jgi:hypothetical protein
MRSMTAEASMAPPLGTGGSPSGPLENSQTGEQRVLVDDRERVGQPLAHVDRAAEDDGAVRRDVLDLVRAREAHL